VALIDFDFAGPNDPLRDLAIAAQHWVPLADPTDMTGLPAGWSPTDRFRAMNEAYRLPPGESGRLLDLVEVYLERGHNGVLARVEAGEERFVAYWHAGLGDRLQRALMWLRSERHALT
jgi:thiamine kinase-like enzyme